MSAVELIDPISYLIKFSTLESKGEEKREIIFYWLIW